MVRNEKLGAEERSALENQDQGRREGARQLPSDGLSVWSRAQQAARSFADKQCYLGRTECSQGVEEASRRMNREKAATVATGRPDCPLREEGGLDESGREGGGSG